VIDIPASGTVLCWCLFAGFWVALRHRVKEDLRPLNARQRAISAMGIVVCALLVYGPLMVPGRAATSHATWPRAVEGLGLALCVAGVSCCIWSRRVLGREWSGGVTAKRDHRLVRKGPYRWVRHPIYAGFAFAIAGTAMVARHAWGVAVLVLVIVGLLAKMAREERLLAALFPEDHAAYRRRTKRLLPYIW